MVQMNEADDPTGGQVASGGGPLDVGNYPMSLVKSERKQSKKNPANWYIDAEFQVHEGPRAGRRVWVMYNLWNDNPDAKTIAWKDWNALCHACGKLRVNDSDELLGIPFMAYVGLQKDDKSKNTIKSYKPLNGAGPVQQPSAGSGSNTGQANVPPWQRRTA